VFKPHDPVTQIGELNLRDWQLWGMAVLLILSLTTALLGTYAPQLIGAPHDLSVQHQLYLTGLSCLVVLFCAYVVHTRYLLGRASQAMVVTLENTAHELADTNERLEREVVERKRMHDELQASQWHLIQAEKMESVGLLAAGVAHEVKNPLATILLGVNYLTNHLTHDDRTTSTVVQEMDEAVKRADSAIKGLLDFSVARALEMRLEDVNAVVEKALLLVKHELDRNHITVVKDLGESLPRVQLDRNKIEQAFVNILLNAVHAMPGGGTVTVRTSLKTLTAGSPQGCCRPGDCRDGETIVMAEVEDTGSGIPEDKLTKIFDSFFTTKPPEVGTGLGLTVTKSILEMHGCVLDIGNRQEGGVMATMCFKAVERP